MTTPADLDLPNVVRRKLSDSRIGDHPDPGMLAAFVEGTLAAFHKPSLLEHFAGCSQCNALLPLISPSRERTQVVLQPARPRSLKWTPFRWAAVAVALIAVVFSVWITRIGIPNALPVRSSIPEPPSASEAQRTGVISQAPLVATSDTKSLSSRERRIPASQVPLGKTAAPFDSVVAAQGHTTASPGIHDGAAYQTGMISAPSATPRGSGDTVKQPATSVLTKAMPPQPKTIWSLSNSGILQHSVDGGRNWEPDAVPAHASLKVVFVMGDQIWTGGERGELYRSRDAGHTWNRVLPASGGRTLLGDVTRIAFTDVHRGFVITDRRQMWITADGGENWIVRSTPEQPDDKQ